MKEKKWQDLPAEGEKERISDFYVPLSLDDIVEYMRIVINEWKNNYGEADISSLRFCELPLIAWFEKKATPEDVERYQELLSEFEVVDNMRAGLIARRLQGKSTKL